MARKVLCGYCNKMVTPAVAKKHKEDAKWAEHLESLGHAPGYTGNPIPPITAEDVFGPVSSPPPTAVDDNMDIDEAAPTLDELSLPLPITNSDHLPPCHHQIPENDFQPDINLDNDLDPLELYDEGLENSALEEELLALANIRYGWSLILMLLQ